MLSWIGGDIKVILRDLSDSDSDSLLHLSEAG